MLRTVLLLAAALLPRAGYAAGEIFSVSPDTRQAAVSYGWYALGLEPFDTDKSAELRNCHVLRWHTVRGLDRSDFGTVVSLEFGLNAHLINDRVAVQGPPDSAGVRAESIIGRDDLGLFRYPLTIYSGLQFTPVTGRLFNVNVTGGIGVGIQPYPLFYTYLHPRVTGIIIPSVLAVDMDVNFIPKSVTDRLDKRISMQQWRVTFLAAPFRNRFMIRFGFFDTLWRTEIAGSTAEEEYSARGIMAGVGFDLGTDK